MRLWGRASAVRPADVAVFTQELATLLRAGLPLDRSLEILISLAASEPVRTLLSQVRDDVRGGASLSAAMEARRGVFSRFYISMLRAGEAGGALDVVLERLSEFMERSRELRETVQSALIYPAILVAVAVLSVVVLLVWVVPQFSAMFESSGKALPLPTQIVIAAGDFVARQLAGDDRVHALDALRRFAVGNGLHLERMQRAELRDLVEGKRRVVDQPDGGRLGHQQRVGHEQILLVRPRPGAGGGLKPPNRENRGVYNRFRPVSQRFWTSERQAQNKTRRTCVRRARNRRREVAPGCGSACLPRRLRRRRGRPSRYRRG